MSKYILTGLLSIAAASASAVTRTVGASGDHATLSAAVAYVNANSAPPNIINIIDNSFTETSVMTISVEMTINGDGESAGVGDGTAADMLVDFGSITGGAGVSAITIDAAGAVTINDLRLHPNEIGDATGNLINGIKCTNPAAGAGTYTFNDVWLTASNPSDVLMNPRAASIAMTDNVWQGDLGLWAITKTAAVGTYTATLTDCIGAGTLRTALYVNNSTGVTTVNSGHFGSAGGVLANIIGASNVNFVGTASNRVQFYRGLLAISDDGFIITGNSNVDMTYVDISQLNLGAWGLALYTGSLDCDWVRMTSPKAGALQNMNQFVEIQDDATFENCTFHFDDPTHANTRLVNFDVNFDSPEAATFTNCIITGDATGASDKQIILETGSTGIKTFTNCALPTTGLESQRLNTTVFSGTGTAATVTNSVTVAPNYMTIAFNPADTANTNWLRPGNSSAYTGTATGGNNLVGGAGGTAVPVTMSGFELE